MIGKILSILFGILTVGAAPGSAQPSTVGKLGMLATYGGAVLWLFGPGREIVYTFNLLELGAIALAGILLGELLWRTPPPAA